MTNVKPLLLFILLVIVCSNLPLHAQSSVSDSLEKVFLNAKDDSTKRKKLDDLFISYMSENHKAGEDNVSRIQAVIQKKGDAKLNYKLLMYRSYALFESDSPAAAKNYIYQFINECKKTTTSRDMQWH